MMCDKEALVGYIYDELGAAERQTFERHLDNCAACKEEVKGLRATRTHLATWAPPAPDFGLPRFRIVRDDAPGTAPRRFGISPAWGLAAAAVLLLAVASAISNIEIRYGADGLTLRTGWGRAPLGTVSAAPQIPATARAVVTADGWKSEFANLDRRLRELEQSAAATPRDAAASSASGPRISESQVLRQVREMVNQSESRQRRELALQLTQVIRDFDAQRQADLVRVQQGLQQVQGLTDAELTTHRQTLNYLVRVAQQPK
jgi:hypothetical protein